MLKNFLNFKQEIPSEDNRNLKLTKEIVNLKGSVASCLTLSMTIFLAQKDRNFFSGIVRVYEFLLLTLPVFPHILTFFFSSHGSVQAPKPVNDLRFPQCKMFSKEILQYHVQF